MLKEIEKAIAQILMSYGVVDNSTLLTFVKELENDHSADLEGQTLDVLFNRINSKVRELGLEVRTVILTDEEGNRVHYHGLVNTEDDYVAVTHGSPYTAIELQFFKDLCSKLIIDKYMSTSDIIQMKRREWSNLETERFLGRVYADKFLQKDTSNYWEIGPRGHLELRPLLESVIGSCDEVQADIDDRIQALPQILFY